MLKCEKENILMKPSPPYSPIPLPRYFPYHQKETCPLAQKAMLKTKFWGAGGKKGKCACIGELLASNIALVNGLSNQSKPVEPSMSNQTKQSKGYLFTNLILRCEMLTESLVLALDSVPKWCICSLVHWNPLDVLLVFILVYS